MQSFYATTTMKGANSDFITGVGSPSLVFIRVVNKTEMKISAGSARDFCPIKTRGVIFLQVLFKWDKYQDITGLIFKIVLFSPLICCTQTLCYPSQNISFRLDRNQTWSKPSPPWKVYIK